MASLTDQLSSPTAGKGIVNPGPVAPSWASGLASLAGDTLTGGLNLFENAERRRSQLEASERQAKADARAEEAHGWAREDHANQQQDRAYKAAGEDIANRTREGLLGIFAGNEDAINSAPIPEAARTRMNEVLRAQKAAGQGRVNPTTVSLLTERFVSEMAQQFPDQVENIYRTANSQGMEHYLFRELNVTREVEESRVTAKAKADDEDYAYGKQWGMQGSFDEVVTQARDHRQKRQAFDDSLQMARDARENKNLTIEESRYLTEVNTAKAGVAARGEIQTLLGAGLRSFSALVASAHGNPEREKQILNMMPGIQSALKAHQSSTRTQLIAAGASEETLKSLDSEYKMVEDGFVALTTGPMSSIEANSKTLANIRLQLGVEDATALRFFTRYSKIYGRDAIDEILLGTMTPETKARIKAEAQGLQTADAEEETVLTARIAQLMQGQAGLRDMTEEQARQAVPRLAAVVNATTPKVLQGDDEATRHFIPSFSNLIEAGIELQPGGTDSRTVLLATTMLAHPDRTNAVEALIRNPATAAQGEAMMAGLRATSAHLLEVARASAPDSVPTKFQRIQWNGRTGQYEVFADEKAYNTWVRQQKSKINPRTGLPVTSYIPPFSQFRKADTGLHNKVLALNAASAALTRTRKHDDEIPAGVTDKQLREHYATGKPLRDQQGKVVKNADEQWMQQAQAFDEQMRRDPTIVLNDPDLQSAERNIRVGKLPEAVGAKIDAAAARHGVPAALARGVAWQESRGRSGLTSSAGARGVMQLMPGTARDLGVDIDDEDQNIEGGVRYLAQMLKRYKGDQRKALAAYNAGPGRVDKAGGVPNIPETRDYVKTILGG